MSFYPSPLKNNDPDTDKRISRPNPNKMRGPRRQWKVVRRTGGIGGVPQSPVPRRTNTPAPLLVRTQRVLGNMGFAGMAADHDKVTGETHIAIEIAARGTASISPLACRVQRSSRRLNRSWASPCRRAHVSTKHGGQMKGSGTPTRRAGLTQDGEPPHSI
jgi:hypothetical protein